MIDLPWWGHALALYGLGGLFTMAYVLRRAIQLKWLSAKTVFLVLALWPLAWISAAYNRKKRRRR